MKALERKVSRAHDELRYLRRLLIDLDGDDQLYDSESDEDEYVGAVEDALNEPYEDDDDEAVAQAQQPDYVAADSAQDQQDICSR